MLDDVEASVRRKVIDIRTAPAENFPPLRCAIRVRSAGAFTSAVAAGPLPVPAGPWQTLQYAANVAAPETSLMALMGSRFTVCCAIAGMASAARSAAAVKSASRNALRM